MMFCIEASALDRALVGMLYAFVSNEFDLELVGSITMFCIKASALDRALVGMLYAFVSNEFDLELIGSITMFCIKASALDRALLGMFYKFDLESVATFMMFFIEASALDRALLWNASRYFAIIDKLALGMSKIYMLKLCRFLPSWIGHMASLNSEEQPEGKRCSERKFCHLAESVSFQMQYFGWTVRKSIFCCARKP
jgi:hypothetical protein